MADEDAKAKAARKGFLGLGALIAPPSDPNAGYESDTQYGQGYQQDITNQKAMDTVNKGSQFMQEPYQQGLDQRMQGAQIDRLRQQGYTEEQIQDVLK